LDLYQEYLAPEICECLVRERFCILRKPVRRPNSDAGVQPCSVGIEERKRVRRAFVARAWFAGYLSQSDQQGDVFVHGKGTQRVEELPPRRSVRSTW
jgi:hypothetical protein